MNDVFAGPLPPRLRASHSGFAMIMMTIAAERLWTDDDLDRIPLGSGAI